MSLRFWYPVAIVVNREDARVVNVAFFDEHVERPETGIDDRVTGRAVSEDGGAAGILEPRLRGSDVLAKLLRRQRVQQLMVIAVRGDFMTAGGDVPDEARKSLRHPAEDEERRIHAMTLEERAEAVGVPN